MLIFQCSHMAGVCWHLTVLRSSFCFAGRHCRDGVDANLQILEGDHLHALFLGLNATLQCLILRAIFSLLYSLAMVSFTLSSIFYHTLALSL
jgi:hypothetical protein